MPVDTIILGAGLAGLAAAQRLSLAGTSVVLVEARDRIGGRAWTRHVPGLEYPVELGPEWFDRDGAVDRLFSGAGPHVVEADGHHWLHSVEGFRDIATTADGGAALHRQLDRLTGPDRPLRDALRACCSTGDLAVAAQLLTRYVEGFHAADPDRLSLQWLRTVEKNQPAERSSLRSLDGVGCAVEMLAAAIGPTGEIRLETVAQSVHWKPGAAEVVVAGPAGRETLAARTVLVTLPLGILAAVGRDLGTVVFSPALAMKREAFDCLEVGPVLKVVLQFDTAFWRAVHPLQDALFVQDFAQPIPTWWSTCPVDAPVITGWAAGPQVNRIGAPRGDDLLPLALDSFAGATAISRETVDLHLRGWHCHDWQRDPFSRGAYSWVAVGGADAHRVLAAPVDRTLFFAGEATCGDGYNATMDGAIASGWRAADEILTNG